MRTGTGDMCVYGDGWVGGWVDGRDIPRMFQDVMGCEDVIPKLSAVFPLP